MTWRAKKKREFEIRLRLLVQDELAHNLDPDDMLESLRDKVREEERLQDERRAFQRTYG